MICYGTLNYKTIFSKFNVAYLKSSDCEFNYHKIFIRIKHYSVRLSGLYLGTMMGYFFYI